MNLEQENEILKKTINDIIDIDQGIYPKSVEGSKNDYEKRTPYMDGWNEAVIENMKMVCKVLDKNGVSIINDKVLIERKYNES